MAAFQAAVVDFANSNCRWAMRVAARQILVGPPMGWVGNILAVAGLRSGQGAELNKAGQGRAELDKAELEAVLDKVVAVGAPAERE